MDDKTFQLMCDRIDRIFRSLIRAMNLEQVRFRINYERERSDTHEGFSTIAEMHPNWQYATGTMVVYVGALIDYDDDEIAAVLIHELVHYWIHPLSRYGESKDYDLLEEKVCTDLAIAIRSVIAKSGEEVAENYRAEIKRLEKQLKQLEKALAKRAA